MFLKIISSGSAYQKWFKKIILQEMHLQKCFQKLLLQSQPILEGVADTFRDLVVTVCVGVEGDGVDQ